MSETPDLAMPLPMAAAGEATGGATLGGVRAVVAAWSRKCCGWTRRPPHNTYRVDLASKCCGGLSLGHHNT